MQQWRRYYHLYTYRQHMARIATENATCTRRKSPKGPKTSVQRPSGGSGAEERTPAQQGASTQASVGTPPTRTFRKTPSADMRADALSKPVQPAEAFHRLASLLLTGRENGST